MLNIQWLDSLLFILLTMPGAFIYLFKKFSFFKYKSLGTIYLYILFIFELIISFFTGKSFNLIVILIIIFCVCFPLCLELNVWSFKDIYTKIILVTSENVSLFIFPILEEIHFRWLIYTVGQLIDITSLSFVLISGLSFGISHIPYLGNKSIYKIIQGLILAVIFLKIGLMMSIACHLIFNMFVYVYKIRTNYKENG